MPNTNNNNTLTLEMQKQLATLPKKVQEVILSDELKETMRAFAKKYKLHFDKWEILEREIMEVLLSLKSPEQLYETLKSSKIGLSEQDAKLMLKDLADSVFTPMHRLLKKIIEEEINNKKEEEYVDPRSPARFKNSDKALGKDLDKPFNLGEAPKIDDPYLEPIEW